MAYENVTSNPGSGGATFATDEVDGDQIPVFKLDAGADGVSTPIIAGRNADAESLPVALSDEGMAALASILAKIIAAPATEAKQDAAIVLLDAIATLLDGTIAVNTGLSLTGLATEAKQDTLIAKDFATQTTLAAVLAKIIAAPATEAKQDTLIAKDFATQTTLAAVLAKIIAAPATEAKQDTGNTALSAIQTAIQIMDDWDESDRAKVNPIAGNAGVTGNTGTVDAGTQRVTLATNVALPAGTNGIGKLTANSGVDIGDVDVTSLPAAYQAAVQGASPPTAFDSYTSAAISAAANTADQQVIAAPGANKQLWVYSWGGTADTGDGSIAFQDEDDTAKTGVMPVSQRGGFSVSAPGNFMMPLFKVATNKKLEIDTVTCGFKGWISYAIVSV